MDRMSKAARSRIMSAIRSKNTRIELLLRRELYHRGVRYRIHYAKAPGTPDIAFIRQKVAVFCDSEFWHGYDWENLKNRFAGNHEYWIAKIERNMERDKIVTAELQEAGWTVLRFWGQRILDDAESCASQIEETIAAKSREVGPR